jgi:hypothetical protein
MPFWVGCGAVLEPVGAHADQPLKLKAAAVHCVLTTDGQFEEIFMLGYSRWQLLKGLAVVVGTISIVSLALIYFIPSPPSTVTMATAFKGSSFEYYATVAEPVETDNSMAISQPSKSGGSEKCCVRCTMANKTAVSRSRWSRLDC